MEETRNKLAQAEPLRGLFALTAAAEFLQWTASHTSESSSCLPSRYFFSSPCNTGDSEASCGAEIFSRNLYSRRLSDSSAEESSCLTSFAGNSTFGSHKTQPKAGRLAHLATVACSTRFALCEFSNLNSFALQTSKKIRSARSFKKNKTSCVGWISMLTPTTVNSPFNPEDGSPGDGTIDTASTGIASSSRISSTSRQNNLSSRQKKPHLKRKENNCRKAIPFKTTRLELRCIAIRKFLVDQTFSSETRIRANFGNTPDTSKALRLLVKQNLVKRFGAGGRPDPFVYMAIVPPGLSELEKLKECGEFSSMICNDSLNFSE
ncbi:hypothetical protein SUGI_1018800 [Cryptomeria japonica]|uniref:uncharacterized protein LOC131059862 n=1 Tax=Cryptomeria japonica TaxID=3369 RepID=UPI0024147592|nr:uncharacterized protein LOC131059862 [Cryptomeria japonica]GLJ48257.1 hypothetical protein SUGI_1018800 [Cryptomeria japonica]